MWPSPEDPAVPGTADLQEEEEEESEEGGLNYIVKRGRRAQLNLQIIHTWSPAVLF